MRSIKLITMNAVILNPRTVKLDCFDPNFLTALAQKVRYLGGIFRTSLLPKKRVATLTFSKLPSVDLMEILHEVNAGINSTAINQSEQSLRTNYPSKSAEAIAPPTLNPEPLAKSTNSPEPVPSHQAITSPTLNPEPLAESTNNPTTVPDDAPDAAHPKENTFASLDELLSQRKTKLKKLAQYHKIPGRSAMTPEQKAQALVGIVLVRDL